MSFVDQFQLYKLDLFTRGVRLPEIEIKAEDKIALGLRPEATNTEYLKKLAWVGCLDKIKSGRIKHSKEECAARLKMEFEVFEKTGTIDYILLLMDIFLWCDKNDIPRGVARGSASGSLALFCLNLISINPLDHNLNFTRFLNEARAKTKTIDGVLYVDGKTFADFDGDVSFNGRPKIIERIERDYLGKTCKILTLQYLTGKMALKDTVKSYLEYSESEALELGHHVETLFGKVDSLNKTYEKNKEFKEWADKNKEAFNIARKIEGLMRGTGQHASGMLISYYNISDILPLENSVHGEQISGYDMETVLTLSLKADLLGLRTLDVLQICEKLTGEKYLDIDINDPAIYQYYNLSDLFYGLFQIEAGLTKEVISKVKPKNIDHLAASLAVSRPGALKYCDAYQKYVHTGERELRHPSIDQILESTGGLILFQESINDICQSVYKMDEVSADDIRRCVTKDTMFVSKTRGWISIESLLRDGYKNDLFLVMDENGKQQWKKLNNIWSTGRQTARYVKASNGMFVKSNRWHRFLTNYGWKARRHLDGEDYLVCAKEIEYDGEDRISLDLALVIAGLVTEGYFVSYHTGATFTNFDSEIMDQFVAAFSKCFGFDRLNITADYRIARIKKEEKRELMKILACGKSRSKILPEAMMGMTIESTRQFLGFMFSCEATISKNELSFTSASIKLAQQVQLLLLRFGIRSNLYSKYNSSYDRDYYVVDIGQHKYVKRFCALFSDTICLTKRLVLEALAARNIEPTGATEIIPPNIMQKFIWEHSYTLNHNSSAQIYKGVVGFDIFKKYAIESGDKKWIDFSNGRHEYSRVRSFNELHDREVELFDFTVDAETPYIVANGMVIHNCIGKKDTEEIKKWEPILYQKGDEQNIPKEITKWFWDTCNASADYLFNKNHCYSYAYLTAYTTYYKVKYPIQFFYACLSMAQHEADPIQCIALVKEEMEKMDMKLSPPSLVSSNNGYTIENNREIRMGLESVKGLSAKGLEKLHNFHNAGSNKFQLFEAFQAASIPLSVSRPLILSGCLDPDIHSRSKLLVELELYKELTDREKPLVHNLGAKYNFDLFNIIKVMNEELKDEKGKPLIKDSRRATLKKKITPAWQKYQANIKNEELSAWVFENEFLGFSYSTTLHKLYSKTIEGLVTVEAAKKLPEREKFVCAAVIDECEFRTSRKGKIPYLLLQLKDETGTLKGFVWNDEAIDANEKANGQKFKAGQIVVVHGVRKHEDGCYVNLGVIQENFVITKNSQLAEKEKEMNVESKL